MAISKHLALLAICCAGLAVPAGCTALVAVGSGAVTAAATVCNESADASVRPIPSPGAPPVPEPGATPPALECPEYSLTDTLTAPQVGVFPPVSGRAGAAVRAAVEAVSRGGRYIAEGNGPVDFDCSGLTAYAWRAAGVRLVDYSYTQWDQTARITRSELLPGDLVFWFGGEVHHVAIVIAVDGAKVTIAEAANPADGVRIRSLGGSWDEAYLTGFGRVTA